MLLSIIVPIYNTNITKLKRCIDSILKIKDIEFEIILIDDGSEKSLNNEYSKIKDKHIRFYTKKNGGVSSARNFGIVQANGKYIMFVDSDDTINANNLKKEVLEDNVDLVLYRYCYIGNKCNRIDNDEMNLPSGIITYETAIRKFVCNSAIYTVWSKLYRLNFIREHNLKFDENVIQSEDAIFNLDCLESRPKIMYYNELLYEYYFDINTSSMRWEKKTDLMFENLLYLITRKKEIVFKLEWKDLLKNIHVELIDILFSLCLEKKSNEDILNVSSDILKQEKINKKELSKKLKCKYLIVINKRKFIIKLLSCFRKIYLIYIKDLFMKKWRN